ncbi:hypothetical protein K8352_04720 [Flavobacteriaceae bacterium F89]|uniref:Uncharacterized protein n=1 Tax=Cerina litoralis TaxID=2874477 RepID=A0AAE3ETA3_9FLAO|nr:hypothetical protein [Cerina litoralis]MCG2460038.1 hypothetical protein [Cerina litoralis]
MNNRATGLRDKVTLYKEVKSSTPNVFGWRKDEINGQHNEGSISKLLIPSIDFYR